MGQERHAVLVTEAERTWLRKGVRAMIDAVKKQQKGLDDLGMDSSTCRRELEVLAGDGVNGGLLTRFQASDTNDLFGSEQPEGQVRQLHHPPEEGEPWEQEPVDPTAWAPPNVAVSLAEEAMEEQARERGGYFEDESGQVYRLVVQGAVAWAFVGQRSAEEVEEAVEAAEGQEEGEEQPKGKGNVNALDALGWASPAARELARTEGLEVQRLAGRGTGADGRLTKRDVLDVLEERDESEPLPEE